MAQHTKIHATTHVAVASKELEKEVEADLLKAKAAKASVKAKAKKKVKDLLDGRKKARSADEGGGEDE